LGLYIQEKLPLQANLKVIPQVKVKESFFFKLTKKLTKNRNKEEPSLIKNRATVDKDKN